MFFSIFFGGLESVSGSFAYVANLVFFYRDFCIQTQRSAVAIRRATNLAIPLPIKPPISLLSHPSPYLATYLPNLATHLPV